MTATDNRKADHPIDAMFIERWSPRAFTNEEIDEKTLLSFFEAARWAPSASNRQPWRFVYALRGTAEWNKLFPILNDFNQGWAKSASALVIILSKTHFQAPGASEAKLSYSHSFDTGAAWGALALQAQLSGYQAHGMTGLHMDKAKEILLSLKERLNKSEDIPAPGLPTPPTYPYLREVAMDRLHEIDPVGHPKTPKNTPGAGGSMTADQIRKLMEQMQQNGGGN